LGSFKEHGVLIYLSRELYNGFIRLQADKGLGRSYAGLLPFVEGLYRLGYISKEVYAEHVRKYSQPLGAECSATIVLSKEQQDKKLLLERKENQFKGQLEQWDDHPDPKWRIRAIAEAEKYPELEYAKLLIEKGRNCDIISQKEESRESS
jgi:hypothetical protein